MNKSKLIKSGYFLALFFFLLSGIITFVTRANFPNGLAVAFLGMGGFSLLLTSICKIVMELKGKR